MASWYLLQNVALPQGHQPPVQLHEFVRVGLRAAAALRRWPSPGTGHAWAGLSRSGTLGPDPTPCPQAPTLS